MHPLESVIKNELCTGCATCAGICPNFAISMRLDHSRHIYLPDINHSICNRCNICYEVCPGHSLDFNGLNTKIFKKIPDDLIIGNYTNLYSGFSNNDLIRYNSASGGMITEMLIFALEEGLIDGALVTRMKKDNPFEPEPFIAKTREEIIEASKSKYCPVPANLAIKEILKNHGKFAVVGLPCHIQGIRKAELHNDKLKSKIIFHLGMLCSYTRNFQATKYLLGRLGIKQNDIYKISYRGEGRIGGMTIELRDGGKRFLAYNDYWVPMLRQFFVPIRCTFCSDHFCELSDISFGDIWVPELISDTMGSSIIITRTILGDELIKKAELKNHIHLNHIEKDSVINSKKSSIIFKKNQLNARLCIMKLLYKNVPNYKQALPRPSYSAYSDAFLLYLQIWISSKPFFWPILPLFAKALGFAGNSFRNLNRIKKKYE